MLLAVFAAESAPGLGPKLPTGFVKSVLENRRLKTSGGIRAPSKITAIPFFSPGLNFCINCLLVRCRFFTA
jgi:hypothetical protein